tara:strand:+ start:2049 stop:2324 length:276 start_codon:yes stop_codon:yes gene_type:complete
MNYYFGVLLCVTFIIIKIIYEKIYNKKNKVELKYYIRESLLLFISYCILIQTLIYFELYDNLNLLGNNLSNEINNFKESGKTMIFTNEPNF